MNENFHTSPIFSPPRCLEAVPVPPSTNKEIVVDRREMMLGREKGRDQGPDQGRARHRPICPGEGAGKLAYSVQ